MPVEIVVPQLGESIVEATILRWLKREGESVAAGEPIVELETDKVNVELPADQSGILQRTARQEGDTVKVGEVIGILEPGEAAAAKTGAAAELPAAPAEARKTAAPTNGAEMNATPVARKLAEENALDLRMVQGTGPNGRITKEDVATHIERWAHAPVTANALAKGARAAQTSIPAQALPEREEPQPVSMARNAPVGPVPSLVESRTEGREERVKMSRRRQTIAARLVEAQHTAAMLTTFNEIDMTAVMDIRKRRKDAFKERHGVNLGFMSFFTKAAIAALKAFPLLNAEIQGDEILLKKYYDIGIAVSTEEGLLVPVIRDADKKTFAEIELEIVDLATRSREGKLTLPELQGGTFTITNGGIFGSLMSTPILNTPQVGILGMHKIQERPVALDGQVVIRPMMYVALSYDHRIVDGAEAVRFLVTVKEMVEDPTGLLVEG